MSEANLRYGSCDGVALLEVVISIALLGVVVFGSVQFEHFVVQQFSNSQKRLTAIHHINNEFEWLRTRGAMNNEIEGSNAGFDSINSSLIDYGDGIELELKVISTKVAGNVKEVEATASFEDGSGGRESISATTMISKFSEYD